MSVELTPRRARTVVAGLTGRRATRSAALWGALFGLLVWNEAIGWHKSLPTVASREAFAHTLGANTGMAAIIGPARQVDTAHGFLAWRMFGLLIIVGAIWGLLLGTRLLRKEEDTGGWELLLSGRTARRHATVQALAGLALGWVVLWTLTVAGTELAGARSDMDVTTSAAVFYATAATASAAMFLAVGALACQLVPSRRQANALAATVFAACYVIRMVADSGLGLAWLRWASPLGWVENLRPLTGSQPLALVPIGRFTAACAVGAAWLADRRDVGSAVIARHESAPARLRLLYGSTGLAIRLERWVMLAWTAGLTLLALLFGVVARSAAAGNVAVKAIQQQVGRLGGAGSGAVAAWIGYEYVFLAALIAFAVAAQLSSLRGEEADSHLDNLLVRRVERRGWLAGRLGLAVGQAAAAGIGIAVGGWLGVSGHGSGLGPADMLKAGLSAAAPALLILGIGTLAYGLAPKLTAPLVYGLILWSFLIEIIGTSLTGNHWLLDTALLAHTGPVPATDIRWTAIGWLCGAGLLAAVAGTAAFGRRDLVAA